MIKVEDALKTILKEIKILDSEAVKLTDALGRILAEDIYSNVNIPGFDNSAMDGYAVKSADTTGASAPKPKVLEVIEDIKAGDMPKKILKTGQVSRIMTGAPIPKGADAVVMVEETKKAKEFVEIYKETKHGENIRKAGEDIKKGKLVMQKGTLLTPAHIGILASLGRPKIKLTKRPKVAILATGDEVVDIDKVVLPAGKLRSSNTYALYSQVLKCGGIPKNLGIAKDRPRELESKIRKGLDCDIILTSGGVSVGDYDLVKFILAKMGTKIKFWKVAMRPGKPLIFGLVKGIPIFGLPGNPVSSMISFEAFVRPAIFKMLGRNGDTGEEVEAVFEEDIKKKKGLKFFLRARTRWEDGAYHTKTTGPQGSAILKSMALANSLIILPEEEENVTKGSRVRVKFFN